MPNPLHELLNEAGEDSPVRPPAGRLKRPVANRVKAELPEEPQDVAQPRVPVAAEPPVEPGPARQPVMPDTASEAEP